MAPEVSWPALDLLFASHPWHGVAIGPDAPRQVTVYVEIVPSDTVKYELDKDSGLLKVDRPQLYSNVCPSPYGFVPRTLCGSRVAALAEEKSGREGLVGDDDPLDILLLTEKDFTHGNILVQALPIGGLGMLDGSEVDDKIVAVMVKDAVYGGVQDLSHLPNLLVDRLKHYFLTYKQAPTEKAPACELTRVYGREEAFEVIRRSQDDYADRFGETLGPLLAKG
jgi:inorganic pyrophosphatase